ncbi:hypothetical protein HanIR_Chr08g0361571 [Helianthus annuus]|nr:hypothetical protein HanIR_Chr08g0361571 [Helianthus annuus]
MCSGQATWSDGPIWLTRSNRANSVKPGQLSESTRSTRLTRSTQLFDTKIWLPFRNYGTVGIGEPLETRVLSGRSHSKGETWFVKHRILARANPQTILTHLIV